MEKWRPVIGNELRYEISNHGNIRNKKTGINLTQINASKGYYQVKILFDDGELTRRVHRLVAQAWIPNPYDLPQINHIDSNKKNNNVSNLEWCTNKQNGDHYRDNGGKWNSKLTPEIIRDIFLRVKNGEMQKLLATEYKISTATVSLICNYKTWSHITNQLK